MRLKRPKFYTACFSLGSCYLIFCRVSLEIEPISCDEMYLNATSVLEKCGGSGDSSSLALFLRKAIEVKLQKKT